MKTFWFGDKCVHDVNISKDNEIIQLKIAELQSNKNSDIRDEMVRKILNFSQDDEYTIIFD